MGRTVMNADDSDHLGTATQLEATIALAEWQRQRHLPPAERVVGIHPAEMAFAAVLDRVAVEMARAS
jgi:hypothetical protein